MASKLFGSVIAKAFNKEIDLDTDTIKVALLTSAYTPNQDTQDYFDDVSAFEATGTGYTAGGVTLTGKSVSYDASTNTTVFDADDVTLAGSTVTARYAVIYDASPATAATRPLIGYIDFVSDKSSNNGDFQLIWDSTGLIKIQVA